MQRITCDIDSNSKVKVLYYVLKGMFKIKRLKRIDIRTSYSNNYHLIFWTNYPYKLKEGFYLRKILGDDLHRLKMDTQRTLGRNTLFYKKQKVNLLKQLK